MSWNDNNHPAAGGGWIGGNGGGGVFNGSGRDNFRRHRVRSEDGEEVVPYHAGGGGGGPPPPPPPPPPPVLPPPPPPRGGSVGSGGSGPRLHNYQNSNHGMSNNNTNNSFDLDDGGVFGVGNGGPGPFPNQVSSSVAPFGSGSDSRGRLGGGGRGGRFGGRDSDGAGHHGPHGRHGQQNRGSFSGPPSDLLPPPPPPHNHRDDRSGSGSMMEDGISQSNNSLLPPPPPVGFRVDTGPSGSFGGGAGGIDRFNGPDFSRHRGPSDRDYNAPPHSSPRREGGGDFRHHHHHHHGRRPSPPPMRESSFREPPPFGGSHRGDNFERTRSDGAISSPYPAGRDGLHRNPSFEQKQHDGGGGLSPRGGGGPPPPFSRGPRDFDSSSHARDFGSRGHSQHGGYHSRGESHGVSSTGSNQRGYHSPFETAPAMPGRVGDSGPSARPSDPRRRSSATEVVQPSLGSYSSLAAEDGPSSLNRQMGGYRSSPVGGMRRSISESGPRGNDRSSVEFFRSSPSHPRKSWSPSTERGRLPFVPSSRFETSKSSTSHGIDPKPKNFQHQSSPGSHRASFQQKERSSTARTLEPNDHPHHDDRRPQRPEIQIIEEEVSGSSAPAAGPDIFGRTRDWQQDRPQMRRATSEGAASRSSPIKVKPLTKLSPVEEKPTLEAPGLEGTIGLTTHVASASAAAPSGPEATRIKNSELLISSLGDADVVKRAETAVKHLHEVVQMGTDSGERKSKLPSKAEIMSALSNIEQLIKQSQKESDDLNEKSAKEKEKEDAIVAQEAKRQAGEEKQKFEKQQESKRKEEEQLKAAALEEALSQSKELFAEEKKKLQTDFDQRLKEAKQKASADMEERLEVDVSEGEKVINNGIAKARRDLDTFKTIEENVATKVVSSEKAYHSLLAEEEQDSKGARTSDGARLLVDDVVSSILAENKRKAREAKLLSFSISGGMLGSNASHETKGTRLEINERRDPKYNRTFEEWAIMAQQVTGLTDALYSEPSEAPYYEFNEERHKLIGPIVKEYIRAKKIQLNEHWEMLAEEYEVRKRSYEKQQRKLAKKARGSISTTRKSMLQGNKDVVRKEDTEKNANVDDSSGGRSTNNPYRRARRGDPVRSEYEQEQIIAQIAEKEAMEKRISHGGSKLPRQIVPLEQELGAVYVNTFNSQRVDPLREAQEEAITNVWSDMEKCIFLDRFLQFPKDFRRIASFLRNKTTRDCVAFYYDSKQTVPYKGALKEHILRRKRKGDYQVWDASIQSALSCGAIITAGEDEEKPVHFGLPKSDITFRTTMLHPLRLEAFGSMEIDLMAAEAHQESGRSEDTKWKSRKRGREPLFSLDTEQTKYLRLASQESFTNQTVRVILDDKEKVKEAEPGASTPKRPAPQKWTATEKKIFVATLEEHGRDWAKLSRAVGTKTISQIKNFYYDFKKQVSSGKFRSGMGKTGMNSGTSTPDPGEKKVAKKKSVAPSVPKLGSKSSLKVSHVSPPQMLSRPSDETEAAPDISGAEMHPHSGLLRQHRQEEMTRNEQQQMLLLRYQEQQAQHQRLIADAESHLAASGLSLQNPAVRNELAERLLAGSSAFTSGDGSNSDLLQQFLSHHSQQQLQHQPPQQEQRPLQHLQPHQASSAIEQLLRGQHHKPEQQPTPRLSLEDTRRLVQQQPHSHHQQQALSSLLPSFQASQLLQPQSHLGDNSSDLSDASSIQRLLQLQRQQQNPMTQRSQLGSLLGLGSSAGTGISASLLAQLEHGLSTGPVGNLGPEPAGGGLAALLGGGGASQGFGSNQLGARNPAGFQHGNNPFFHQGGGDTLGNQNTDATGVSEAFALIQRAMQRDSNNFRGTG